MLDVIIFVMILLIILIDIKLFLFNSFIKIITKAHHLYYDIYHTYIQMIYIDLNMIC